jgi:hypothetical protein
MCCQARSALGDYEQALQDLQKAIDLLPLWGQVCSETLHPSSSLQALLQHNSESQCPACTHISLPSAALAGFITVHGRVLC